MIPSENEVGGWIVVRMMERSLPNTPEAAKWRVLLAAFWDVTRPDPPTQEHRPDKPQWDIVSLRSALENWGRHFQWCDRVCTDDKPCSCGLADALGIGQYATLDPNGFERGNTLAMCAPPKGGAE